MRRLLFALMAVCAISLFAQDAPPPGGQGRGRGGAPKNLKILKPDEVRATMGAFVAGTGIRCGGCHVQGDFASDEKQEKVVARKMLEMVRGINANTFNGEEKVTCYTCHRGEEHPKSSAQ
ncbi:MAG TPA: c-type cytochrome [Bryobacteraceae bacterium]|nr:c-type cytochrome [Bryobacteraceae bacterium]